MKRNKVSKLHDKSTRVASPLGTPDLLTALRNEPGFFGRPKAEVQDEFVRTLSSSRWIASEEHRRPAPLGPLRFDFDEDGVPTYLG